MGRRAKPEIQDRPGIEAGLAIRETRDKWARQVTRAKRDRPETGAGPEIQVKQDAPVTQAKRDAQATRARKGRPHRVRRESIAIRTMTLEERVV